MTPAEHRLTAARTKLILDHPFLGALALRLPLQAVVEQPWCTTTGTDARTFYYNPAYIDQLSPAQTQFIVAHEALHCGLSHFARRHHRNKLRWDLACDLAINPLLQEEGLQPAPGYVVIEEYRGLTAEEIYPLLEENPESEQPDHHLYDRSESEQGGTPPPAAEPSSGNAGQPQPLTPDERETLRIQWQQRMAGAAQQAMQAGRLHGTLARLLDHLLQPQLPWRMLLAHYLNSSGREAYSYMRPSRRQGDFILPSLRSKEIDLVIALDTSASIKAAEYAEFVAEIDAIKGQLRARITLLACDSQLAPNVPWIFEPWDHFALPAGISGQGGTCFTPVFDWIERQDLRPQALVYFTDGDGEFPATPPAYPVLWLVKGRRPVPWGERIPLN